MAKVLLIGSKIPFQVKSFFTDKGHSVGHYTDQFISRCKPGHLHSIANYHFVDLLIAYPAYSNLLIKNVTVSDRNNIDREIKYSCEIYNLPINRICFINPRSALITAIFRNPDQVISPEYMGDRNVNMRPLIWLKNLPTLNINARAKEDIFKLMADQWDHLLLKTIQSNLFL